MPVYVLGDQAPVLPAIGGYWIAPDAHVMGAVTLGRDVGVWFGAVIRGDNAPITIGAGTNVQEGAMLHVDPGFPLSVGPGCTIGHHAIVHGCTLGENVLIGMGATVMNGAVIEPNSMVGAGALVTEGKTFPAGSLIVGSPARAVRTLDAAGVAGLRSSAAHYVATWQRYASELKPVDI